MSLRQIAKELGISPTYLSYMLNGKRPWRKDLYQRYLGVVNTFVNSDEEGVNSQIKRPPRSAVSSGAYKVGAGRGTRTHTPAKVADFKSAASAIPPSRHCGQGYTDCTFWNSGWEYLLVGGNLGGEGEVFGGDGRIRTAE